MRTQLKSHIYHEINDQSIVTVYDRTEKKYLARGFWFQDMILDFLTTFGILEDKGDNRFYFYI